MIRPHGIIIGRKQGHEMVKYPSRIRYEEDNPTVTLRLTSDLKAALDEVRGERSYADLVRDMLRDSAVISSQARKRYQITCNCSRCGREIPIEPGSLIHKEVLQYLNGKWYHAECKR